MHTCSHWQTSNIDINSQLSPPATNYYFFFFKEKSFHYPPSTTVYLINFFHSFLNLPHKNGTPAFLFFPLRIFWSLNNTRSHCCIPTLHFFLYFSWSDIYQFKIKRSKESSFFPFSSDLSYFFSSYYFLQILQTRGKRHHSTLLSCKFISKAFCSLYFGRYVDVLLSMWVIFFPLIFLKNIGFKQKGDAIILQRFRGYSKGSVF